MKATWEKTDKNQGILTVEVEEEKVASALDQAFKKVVKRVTVPGFRKGKVPRKIFEARFGVEVLYEDALNILLPEAYGQAVEETGIEPVDRPEVDIKQMEKGKALIFTAKVTVKPEVQLGQYKGLKVEKKEFAVTDEDVENELKRQQERVASIEVVEDAEAQLQDGDYAVIDFEGFVEGEPIEGGKGEDFTLVIGSGSFIPGFEEQLVGMKKGEEREVKITFPDDYHMKQLAGKPATFKVQLKEIKRKNLPPLDDEFAKDVSEFETLEELKQDIRRKLEEKAKEDEENYKRDAVVEKAAENATMDIPQVMIDNEIHNMIHEFEDRLRFQGLNLKTYFNLTGMNEERLREQFKADAEKRVRINLTLEAIAKAENIEVTDEDLEKELETYAEQWNRSKDEVRSVFEARGLLDGIKQGLRNRKTIDFLVENSIYA